MLITNQHIISLSSIIAYASNCSLQNATIALHKVAFTCRHPLPGVG